MSEKRNIISKGRTSLRKSFDRIRFALFGTSLALPGILFTNCSGSCGNCYRCIVSATPMAIIILMIAGRKVKKLFKKYSFNKLEIKHESAGSAHGLR